MTGNSFLRTPVAIVGGGMIGLALGVSLAEAGLEALVLEKEPMSAQLLPEFDGRVSALSLGSVRLLKNIGVWQAMRDHAQPINDILVRDDGSPAYVHYDHQDVGSEPMGYILENRHIRQAVQRRAGELPLLTVMASAEYSDIENTPHAAAIILKDGARIQTQLIVAADSRYSRLRTLAGIESVTRDYRQTAIVTTIAHEKPHHGLALERFFAEGPFAVLPMQGDRSSLVWVEPTQRAGSMLKLDQKAMEEQIARRAGSGLGAIRREGGVFSYPLHFVLAKAFYRGRVVLAGDAAHGIHPIAGQGVNLGYRDVAALTEVLTKAAKLGQDLGGMAVMQEYQRWRSFDSLTMLGVTDGLTRLFSNRNPFLKLARNLGLGAVQNLPPAKYFFMRHAMGVAGNLPPLMQQKNAA